MIVLVREQYHDYQPQTYMIDSDKLDGVNNPIDKRVLKALKGKNFAQKVYVQVDEEQAKPGADAMFWEEPNITDAEVEGEDVKPDKFVDLTINFDC